MSRAQRRRVADTNHIRERIRRYAPVVIQHAQQVNDGEVKQVQIKGMRVTAMNSDYTRWELVDSPDDFNWDEVSYDGNGYVILKDGSRLDVKPDLYESEREEWNAKKNEQDAE